jgi:putative tricarboxylic transport membrane protein
MSLARWLGAASALIGAGLLFVIIPWQTERAALLTALDPKAYPSAAAILIIVTGLVQLVWPTGSALLDWRRMGRAVAIVAICVAGVLLLEFAGYLIAGPVVVAAVMLMAGERRWLWLAVGILAMPAAIWAVFELLLRRPLP